MVAIDQVEASLVFFPTQDCTSSAEKKMPPAEIMPASPFSLLNSARR
jgi:hypothetical protein